jgi:hypothetical protein
MSEGPAVKPVSSRIRAASAAHGSDSEMAPQPIEIAQNGLENGSR